jgi:pimeloyl-ACP methyl ester carboxylesterase
VFGVGHALLTWDQGISPPSNPLPPSILGSRLLRLNARSHFPMFEAPEAMATAIERFLS